MTKHGKWYCVDCGRFRDEAGPDAVASVCMGCYQKRVKATESTAIKNV